MSLKKKLTEKNLLRNSTVISGGWVGPDVLLSE